MQADVPNFTPVKRARVLIRLKPQLLDSAGHTVQEALKALGFEGLERVRVGKVIELEGENLDQDTLEQMCRQLLANPVTEEFEIQFES